MRGRPGREDFVIPSGPSLGEINDDSQLRYHMGMSVNEKLER